MMTTNETDAPAALRHRILIVEDEAVIAMDMAQHLRDFGYDVVGIAASDERALELAAKCHPDLVMMDIVIKGSRDGIDTAREIRSRADIPVIFLTAYGDTRTLERAKAASPHGYLLKPFRANELRTTIEVALHKQALEKRVRDSERWLMRTLQCIGDGVIATDPAGRVRFMNPIAEALTGFGMEQARGREASQVCRLRTEDGADDLPDLLHLALRDGAATSLLRGLIHPPGGEPRLYVDAGAAPIRDDDGRLLGGVLVLRDVTQRRLDERELQSYREHLEALVRERTRELEAAKLAAEHSSQARLDFLSSISHEMRTPLNAVLGFSQLLALEPLTTRQLGQVKHIEEAGRHLLRVIDDLLDLAKNDAGRLTVQHARVDVAAVLEPSADLVRPMAAAAGVSLAIEPTQERFVVAADPMRLTQVLVNLLSNAVKYNRKGGRVRVSCAALDDHQVRIDVADTGPGISPEQQARLFRAFERLGAEASAVGGVGIGLALSQRLVHLMQGELRVRSEVGIGSTFSVDLPRCTDAGARDDSFPARKA